MFAVARDETESMVPLRPPAPGHLPTGILYSDAGRPLSFAVASDAVKSMERLRPRAPGQSASDVQRSCAGRSFSFAVASNPVKPRTDSRPPACGQMANGVQNLVAARTRPATNRLFPSGYVPGAPLLRSPAIQRNPSHDCDRQSPASCALEPSKKVPGSLSLEVS